MTQQSINWEDSEQKGDSIVLQGGFCCCCHHQCHHCCHCPCQWWQLLSKNYWEIGYHTPVPRHTRYGARVGGSLSNTVNLILDYFCTIFYIGWACDFTRPSTTHNQPNEHRDHGGRAACPSSGKDSMNPCHLRVGRPCACLFQGRR
jgi:hypothetical protein